MAEIIVETERLRVRRWTVGDLEAAWAMYSDPEVTRYLGGGTTHTDREQTRAWLERVIARNPAGRALGFWAVEERATGRVVGSGLLQPAPINGGQPVEVGYHLARSAWGQGYATELARALVRFGFEEAGLEEIWGVVLPGNAASRRVLEKAGLREIGMAEYGGTPVEAFVITRAEHAEAVSG